MKAYNVSQMRILVPKTRFLNQLFEGKVSIRIMIFSPLFLKLKSITLINRQASNCLIKNDHALRKSYVL